MPKVSVIIPNYNGAAYIDDCLKSLTKQTFRDFDVYVIDNGSYDGSLERIRNEWIGGTGGIAAKSGRRLRIHLKELGSNTGFAHAVNVGIEESKASESTYVFLLNNDAICEEETIDNLVRIMDRKKKLFSAQAKMLKIQDPHDIDDSGDLYCALGWAFSPGRDSDNRRFSKRESLTSACAGAAIYRREYFEEVGLFDEVHFCYLEDVDIGYRARLKGYANIMEPAAIVYHAGSASSGSRYNSFKVELTAANNLYFIYKNMPIFQIFINFPMILAGIIVKHIFYTRKGLGWVHLKGLVNGFRKITANGDKKVEFHGREIRNALRLQIELWVNCARRALSV